MRIALLSSNFWPEPTGTSQPTTDLALYLAEHGQTVCVATAMPYYPQWRIWPDYRGRLWKRDAVKDVTIFRSWHFVRPRPSTVTRLLHEITLSVVAIPSMIRVLWRAQVAVVVSPALSYAFVALCLARLLRARTVLIVQDVMPDAAVELGMLKNPWMIGLSRWIARGAYALAKRICTLAPGMAARIGRLTRRPDKIHVLPNGVNTGEFAPVEEKGNEFRRRFVKPGMFAVLHAGNMGKKQDTDVILRAAERLRDEDDICFYVFGEGAERERFLARREELKLTNVRHFPLQERWMVPHMLSGADVVLVTQQPEVVDIVVPSKLLTAMASGAMILAAASAKSETARLVNESGGGITVAPGDERALVAGIREIQGGRVDAAECRRRARQFAVAHFDRERVFSSFLADAVV